MAIFSATHNIDDRKQFHLVQSPPVSVGTSLEESPTGWTSFYPSWHSSPFQSCFSNPEESPVYKQCPRDVTIGMTAVRILCIPKENTWKGGR